MDKGRLAFVRAHVGGKGGSGARVEDFRALLAQPRALAHFVASLLLSFPSAQKGEAPATCDLFYAISCACLLLHNFSTKKTACPARDVAPALARLLVTTQRIAAYDWLSLPSAVDATAFALSREVAVAFFFELPTEALGSSASYMQRITE